MTVYLITYDLNKSDKNYEGLHNEIVKLSNNNWCKPLKSVYLIRSSLSSQSISEQIMNVIDKNDYLLVIEVKNNKYGWLTQQMWDYINQYLF
ncbi:MAG: hypothetical protein GX675_04860 [Erysipelotrichaceae bacterium]|nr:hypothetical protein [Erysipelotrichaceae bacterium]